MNRHSRLIFALGAIRHPRQAWRRFRELAQIAIAPSLGDRVPSDALADVELIPVESDESLQGILIAMYSDNPSPFVIAPKSAENLQEYLGSGIQFFLIVNGEKEYVGARAFNPSTKMLLGSVTDYRHRGKGYQLAAGIKLRNFLAKEGHTEFHALVLCTNTRMQRNMHAAGWEMEPDPDNPDMIRGTLRLDV